MEVAAKDIERLGGTTELIDVGKQTVRRGVLIKELLGEQKELLIISKK